MSFVYVIQSITPKGGNPDKKPSTILVVQNGPARTHDETKKNEFVNSLAIRVPPHMDLSEIESGKFANITWHEQGVISRRNPDKPFRTIELVARSVKPAQPWQLGVPEALYPVEE
jgi:hypothetical protein